MGHSHRNWICPYFSYDEKTRVHCEAGVIRMPDVPAMLAFARTYCGNLPGWEQCPLAQSMSAYYDRVEEQTKARNTRR